MNVETENMTESAGQHCALCEAHAQAATSAAVALRTRGRIDYDALFPWLLVFGITGPLGFFMDGGERWLSLGLFAGLAVGGLLAWRARRQANRRAEAAIAAAVEGARLDADQRVNVVIRQFEWAVNDVANLREALAKAQAAHVEAEARVKQAKREIYHLAQRLFEARAQIGEFSRALGEVRALKEVPPEQYEPAVVPLAWRVYEENSLVYIRLETTDLAPVQVRVLNEDESVVAISARTLDAGEAASIVLRVPQEVATAIVHGHEHSFRFEALVDDEWRPVELRETVEPAAPPAPVKDKRGRVWRDKDGHHKGHPRALAS